MPLSNEPVKYLAIDPGETTGWATFDANGIETAIGQVAQKDFNTWFIQMLREHDIDTVICEDYKNFGWMEQKKWSKNQTSKNIGGIEMACDSMGVKCVLQSNTKYALGAGYGGFDIPSNHSISHQFVALAHGIYYLQEEIHVRPVGLAIPDE